MTIVLSLSARILVNVEALNMAESVGNVVRHRRAPIVVASGGKYSIVYVPAVSGESIAHHYQRILTSIAESMKLPVTNMDRQGYFLKYADNTIINNWYPEVKDVIKEADPCNVERTLVEKSVVADVSGFLYTDKLIKRMSRIRFSYLIPGYDAVESGAAASYPQLHTRYAPPQAARGAQAIYYVESGSSLYTLSAELVASDIARLEYCETENELQDKMERVKASLKALSALIDGLAFGAKRSRYMPVWDVRSMIISVSKGPIEFVVSPSTTRSYFEGTLKRVKLMSENLDLKIKTFIYNKEDIEIPDIPKVEVERFDTHTEALARASSHVIELMGGTK